MKIYKKNAFLCVDEENGNVHYLPEGETDFDALGSGNYNVFRTTNQTERYSFHFSDLKDINGELVGVESVVIEYLTLTVAENINDLATNDIGRGAFGKPKVILDRSILHGLFTFNIPDTKWFEVFNGTEQSFTNATSVNGKLNLVAGATLNDVTCLRTFRNPRYEPNRGQIYSSSEFLPSPDALGSRRFGMFTAESGTFFNLRSGSLYATVRTTIDSVTTDDEYLIDTTGLDLSKGQLYDINYQWRGVGDYNFYIDQKLVKVIKYDGALIELSSFNPALPLAYECENLGDNVVLESGCADVSTEGGDERGKEYGSIGMTSESGQVAISGFNVPIIAIRSKATHNGLINTRDTLALLATGYADQRAFLRVWQTRDVSAITVNDQSWTDYGDGNLEFITYDQPDVVTPMTFDTTKARLIFGSRVDQDQSYSTSALFEGRTDIHLTPNDIFIFSMHRETAAAANVGVTFEFAEEI